jgi:YVTN family beta-propeller protein
MGLAAPAFAGSSEFPTYHAGPSPAGWPAGSWVVSNGQVITPAGTQVYLGTQLRAKAIAIDPTPGSHTAAALTLGAAEAVVVFDTRTGVVMLNYLPFGDSSGSYGGIDYSPDGKFLIISQDSSNVSVAQVFHTPSGKFTGLHDWQRASVPPDNSFIQCFPNSPPGNGRPCGTFYTTSTSYPGGVAFSHNGKNAYAILNQNNTLTKIAMTPPLTQGKQVRVGNAPNHVVISADDKIAYVSNEGGRVATEADFQIYSAGTPIVADKVNGRSITGTVSKVDLGTMQVVDTIHDLGLHPTGMATFGPFLLVCNTYSDTISVIDTRTDKVAREIDLGLPISVAGQASPAYGAGPNAIVVDPSAGVAYVALYNANAIAVVDLSGGATKPVLGLIPVGYAPDSVKLYKADNLLVVSNDKGIGTRLTYETDYGVSGYNTHQDDGTASIIPIPNAAQLGAYTKQVYQNNHWDLDANIDSSGGGSSSTSPVAIPAKIGDPSLIKHVFMVIRENRTYDQVLGDVKAGNGYAKYAVFGCCKATNPAAISNDTPNAHAWVTRFPLLDNFYDPSRQSADGHQWIIEGMAPYADDIQSPDWVRSYPGGGAGDALVYQKKGFLFQEAVDAGLSVKIFGEYGENENFPTPLGHPSWSQFYADALKFEAGQEKTLKYQNAILETSSIPVVSDHLLKNFPQFDLDIPDQWRVDFWWQDFEKDLESNTVPALTIMWIIDDHTGGPPTADAEQADNDLAVGRIIDYISHSKVWDSSAIFIEEDDAQNGVDHVDGHRSPGYVISPYVVQNTGSAIKTYYTQVNMTRAIEQILGLPPMNQFDLVATPMTDVFVKGTPPAANFAPWVHVPNIVPLDQGVSPLAGASAMEKAWQVVKQKISTSKLATTPDAVDADLLNHYGWYDARHYVVPYPGESQVRSPASFRSAMDRLNEGAASKSPESRDDD